MNRKQAIEQLTRTKQLSTKMLKPLNIPFEAFLRLSQVSEKTANEVIEALIKELTRGKP